MTTPVTQQENEKIAMTAPVIQRGGDTTWKVRFVMPSDYTIETLPTPNKTEIKIRNIPEKKFVVIRFSGLAGKESLQRYTKELNAFIDKKN